MTQEALSSMKKRHRAMPAELLQDANHFIPPAVFARAARATLTLDSSSRGRPNWNLVISNVPGPQFPLYCAGAELVANYPVSVITDGMGLNMTVMSYRGPHGLRDRHRPRPDARRLAADRLARRGAQRAARGNEGSSLIESRSASSDAHSITSGLASAALRMCSSACSGCPPSAL